MIASTDGCKAGWLVALSTAWPCKDTPHLFICRRFEEVLELTAACDVVVVDIPIGLPTGTQTRLCDGLAKNMLGQGNSRVFLAPPRETLEAKTPEAFQAAHKQSRGVGAGYPVWGIVPKLKEVDSLMSEQLQEKVREFHPELTWANFGIAASKHSSDGIERRRKLLDTCVPDLTRCLQWKSRLGRAAQTDDILDAIVGLSVADAIRDSAKPERRLPADDPPRDLRGLRMEIWF